MFQTYNPVSEYPIGFHYIRGVDMRIMYYNVYKLKFAGLGNVTDDLTDDPNDTRFTFIEADEKKTDVPLDEAAYTENITQNQC